MIKCLFIDTSRNYVIVIFSKIIVYYSSSLVSSRMLRQFLTLGHVQIFSSTIIIIFFKFLTDQITQNAQCVTVTVNPSSVPYQAFPVEAEQEQAHDYYEISDHYETAKTASTTVDDLIPSSDSNKYCCTPQPSDCEYELPKVRVWLVTICACMLILV